MANTPGGILKAERERQKKSLREISQKLKLNREYLKAIESENYSILPAEIFTRSYIRMYADALGLDSDSIVNLYDGLARPETADIEPPAGITVPESLDIRSTLRSYISRKVIVITAVVMAASAVFFLTFRDKPQFQEAARPAAEEPVSPESESGTVAAEAAKPESQAVQEPAPVQQPVRQETRKPVDAQSLFLKIVADDLTWVSVRIDRGSPGEWFLRPGESIELTARERFALKIGNAGGTRLFLNGQDIGVLGPRGHIIDIVLPDQNSTL